MDQNGVSGTEDTDMAECDGEKVVTMMDVLQEQEEFEDNANAVLGASDDKNCTFSKGYIKRQALYACLTCCNDAKLDPDKRAGVCLACSLTCHENHELIELYTKRNFRCDCGNPKFNSHPCLFTPEKPNLNVDNKYNQNFSGMYCICHRPYPDPDSPTDDEMIQCIVCEDWLHAAHLDAMVPTNDQYSEMICKSCFENNDFLLDYSSIAVNMFENDEVDVLDLQSTNINDLLENSLKVDNGDLENKLNGLCELTSNCKENEPKTVNETEMSVVATDEQNTQIMKSSTENELNGSGDDQALGEIITNTSKTIKENDLSISGEDMLQKKDDMSNNESSAEENKAVITNNDKDENMEMSQEELLLKDNDDMTENDTVDQTPSDGENAKSNEVEAATDKEENTCLNRELDENTKMEECLVKDTNKDIAVEMESDIRNNELKQVASSSIEKNDETATVDFSEEKKGENQVVSSSDDITSSEAVIEPNKSDNSQKLDENKSENIEESNVDEKTVVSESQKDDIEETLLDNNDSCEKVQSSADIKVTEAIGNDKKTEDSECEIPALDVTIKDDQKEDAVKDIKSLEVKEVGHLSENIDKPDSTKASTDDKDNETENTSKTDVNELPSNSTETSNLVLSTPTIDDCDIKDSVSKNIGEETQPESNNTDKPNENDALAEDVLEENIKDNLMDSSSMNIEEKEFQEKTDLIANEDSSADVKSVEAMNTEVPTNEINNDITPIVNDTNKRKLSAQDDQQDTISNKKTKLDDSIKEKDCKRPERSSKRTIKGATFWPCSWRQRLCSCYECISMYRSNSVLFLLDPEDTVSAYEDLGKAKNGGKSSQYEKGLEALSSLDRVQQINALTEYNRMKDKLLDFLKSFKEKKEVVKEEDIKEFFAGMKPRKERDGVYFCR